MLKGQTEADLWFVGAETDTDFVPPPTQLIDGTDASSIPLAGAKAVFFVKSFEGPSREDLRFSDHLQPLACLWVRVTYRDGEVIEGIIRNDSSFAFRKMFFMAPVDPEGNNKLVLVIKDQLQNFQILGLRHPSMELALPIREAIPLADGL